MALSRSSLVKHGDFVTISDQNGHRRKGRAVMRGPAGWVLNMGGPHGTPKIASDDNIVKIRHAPNRVS